MWRFRLFIAGMAIVLAGCGNSDAPNPLNDASATGLQTQDLFVGTGPYPLPGQRVAISYTGTLENGTKFDASADHGSDLVFTLGSGQVIRGLDLGVTSMKVGSHRKMTISPDLAYGAAGAPPAIPPNATLIFDVWLVSAN